jgi:RNA polymerase primary sigma factor
MATARSAASSRRPASGDRAEDDSLTQYLGEIRRYPLLSADEEHRLALQASQGDAQGLDALVRANLRFVVFEAKRYQHHGVALGDLVSEGNLGLLAAARRFDPTRGVRFVSYASWWIRQAILRALIERGPLVRVPIRRAEAVREADRARAATATNVCTVGRADEDQVRAARRIPLSFDADLREQDGTTLAETVADTRLPSPEDMISSGELHTSIEAALGELDAREAEILRLNFGLDARGQYTPEEIARLLGMTVPQVCRQRERALHRLRRIPHGRALGAFAA